jgi:hypothetical protein
MDIEFDAEKDEVNRFKHRLIASTTPLSMSCGMSARE